jgi:DnaJ-class molecular chaperone
MRDPYDVLGVQRTADAAAIKNAFRKLAKKHHPDANKGDPKASAQRFSEVNAAYEILGDQDKRKAFDRGEIDADGKQRFQGFEGFRGQPGGGFGQGDFETMFPGGFARGGRAGGFGGFEDLLKGMFGGAAGGRRPGFETHGEVDEMSGARARDVTVPLTISLAEAAQGGTRRVRLPSGKEVDLKIPAGLADGQQIRLKGQGPSAGPGVVGDALIAVTIAPHKLFIREGANLRLELPVALYEAVLGAKVRVPTLDGAVELAIPAGTNSGRTFRLKGKGMPGKGGAGDLLAVVRIVLPDRGDDTLSKLMREWREDRPYDPRKDLE